MYRGFTAVTIFSLSLAALECFSRIAFKADPIETIFSTIAVAGVTSATGALTTSYENSLRRYALAAAAMVASGCVMDTLLGPPTYPNEPSSASSFYVSTLNT